MYTMIGLGKACKQHFDRRRPSNQCQETCRVGLWYVSPTRGVFILVETRLSHFTGSDIGGFVVTSLFTFLFISIRFTNRRCRRIYQLGAKIKSAGLFIHVVCVDILNSASRILQC